MAALCEFHDAGKEILAQITKDSALLEYAQKTWKMTWISNKSLKLGA